MAAFRRRGNAWRAQVRLRGQALSATFGTREEAGTKAKNGRAAFLAPAADLFRRYRGEVSPNKRDGRREAVLLRLGHRRRFRHGGGGDGHGHRRAAPSACPPPSAASSG